MLSGYRVSFWGDEHALELGRGWFCNLVNVLLVNATDMFTLKWLMINFMLCGLYLSWKKVGREANNFSPFLFSPPSPPLVGLAEW